ncbi:unnamed protein product, partial [Allacma fusca]
MSCRICSCASGRDARSDSVDPSPYEPPRHSISSSSSAAVNDGDRKSSDGFAIPSIFKPIQVDSEALERVPSQIYVSNSSSDNHTDGACATSTTLTVLPGSCVERDCTITCEATLESYKAGSTVPVSSEAREDECDSIHSQSSRTLSNSSSMLGDPEAEEPLLGSRSQLDFEDQEEPEELDVQVLQLNVDDRDLIHASLGTSSIDSGSHEP